MFFKDLSSTFFMEKTLTSGLVDFIVTSGGSCSLLRATHIGTSNGSEAVIVYVKQ